MSKKHSERSWKKARKSNRSIVLVPSTSLSTATLTAKDLVFSENSEISYLVKPWGAIFKIAFLWFLRFFAVAMLSFHILIVGLIPIWVIFIYNFFYVFFKRLKKFNISRIKFGIFSAFVIISEIVASHFLREIIMMIYKSIFW